MSSTNSEPDRRKYKRIARHFILTYYDQAHPENRFEATQLKNIGIGGMCLITSRPFAPNSKLGIELKTPILLELTHLEGVVLQSHEKIHNLVYETRLKFEKLSPEAVYLLGQLVEHFDKKEDI